MKIAVWLDNDYKPTEGGGFSYYEKLIQAIDKYQFDESLKIVFVSYSNKDIGINKDLITLENEVKPSLKIKIQLLIYKFVPFLGKYKIKKINSYLIQKRNQFNKTTLKKNNIKIIYYLRQSECEIPNFPFIATNWDIGHLSTFAFPELVENGEFERRKRWYNNILPKALLVFAESEAGRRELLKYTNLNEKKIKVVPIFAGNLVNTSVSDSEQISILNKYDLTKNKFFFYPAQFWAHKNHYNLVKAFYEFRKEHPEYKLVFTGSDKGNQKYIQETVNKLNLSKSVSFLGFVSIEELYSLYKNAAAMVMPSFFGPTNIPPLEAMNLNCPILCSDLEGHREILSDSAIYFSPDNISEITSSLKLMLDDKYREEMKNKLNIVVENSKFNIKTAVSLIEKFLIELSSIRKSWN